MKGTSSGLSSPRYQALKKRERFAFLEEWNRGEANTDYWTTGDTGAYGPQIDVDGPPAFLLVTGGVGNDDRYIHGVAPLNKRFSLTDMEDYTTLTWELKASILTWWTDIQIFMGLVSTVFTDYAEPNESMHFLVDTGVTATFRARSHSAAEEETDTLVALDGAYHVFKMVATATEILFYIDDVLVATHAAQIPLRSLANEIAVRAVGAAARYLAVDYLRVTLS